MVKEAIVVAGIIGISIRSDEIRRKRNECPAAAINAQKRYVFFGGLLIAENPIAAIAEKKASLKKTSVINKCSDLNVVGK